MRLNTAHKTLVLVAACTAGFGALIGYAVAEGAPSTQPLFYSGLVTSKQGVPLDSTHSVSLRLFGAETAGNELCATPALAATFTAGRFRIALPSGDKGCAQAIANNPDTWVELTVDDVAFPRSKVGAMPYALESSHAKSASALTGSQADTLAQLSTAVAALQAAGGTTPAGGPAPKLSVRILHDGAGCEYLPADNATRCTCEPGELVTSMGGWSGPSGVLNSSRFEKAADEAASDSDRQRIWTMSCTTLGGAPVRCQSVQAACIKL